MTLRRTCRLTCAVALLAAGALLAATAVVPQRARAQDSGAQAAPQAKAADGAEAGGSWCARIPPGYGHPPANLTPLALRVLDPSIEPVQTTDGLIHLAYTAQVTNAQATPADIASVVPVDPLAGFAPTGRNSAIDAQGNDVAGRVELFATSQLPGPFVTPSFTASVPAGNAGLMYFDVIYTDPAQIRDLHRPGADPPPALARDHAGPVQRRRAGDAHAYQSSAGRLQEAGCAAPAPGRAGLARC